MNLVKSKQRVADHGEVFTPERLVEAKFGKSVFEKKHYALLGLMCIYGIELSEDNIKECLENML